MRGNDGDAVITDIAVTSWHHYPKERWFSTVVEVDATKKLLEVSRGFADVRHAELHLEGPTGDRHGRHIDLADVLSVMEHLCVIALSVGRKSRTITLSKRTPK